MPQWSSSGCAIAAHLHGRRMQIPDTPVTRGTVLISLLLPSLMPSLPELRELETILHQSGHHADVSVLCHVVTRHKRFPVYKIALGNPDPSLPAIGFFGGIHGLERIGTQVLLAFLRGTLSRLRWDVSLQHMLEHIRIVFIPLINPGGMWLGTRANPNGVDLMRNSPVEAREKVPLLLGGHRVSNLLPWYRGPAGQEMEAENLVLAETVRQELMGRPFSLAVDCHSGFGLRDRVWFPLAHTADPIPHLAEVIALEELFEQTHPSHRYLFEPQSLQYRTHGDIWDYLYLEALQQPQHCFLPLTLEMGSWLWVKKNPRQLFSRLGMFNPVAEHRLHRVLRRHTSWLDFLMRATCGYQSWQVSGPRRLRMQEQAVRRWFNP